LELGATFLLALKATLSKHVVLIKVKAVFKCFWTAFKISLFVEQLTAISNVLQIVITFSLCFSTSEVVFPIN